jgi:NTE family protein
VDIVLIEPEPADELMFQTSMMNFSSRVDIVSHGFRSVTRHLFGMYDRYSEIAERHGIEISGERVSRVIEHFDGEQDVSSALREILEETAGLSRRQSAGSLG